MSVAIDVPALFRAAGAWRTGHFILSSGRHSPVFLQKALVFSDPRLGEKLCRALARLIAEASGRVDLVCAPAIGGIVPGYETARHLRCRAFFSEREKGRMRLRRGFDIAPGERVVIVEDIVTTGRSLLECRDAVQERCAAAEIVAAACVVDRSGGRAAVEGLPLLALHTEDLKDYAPDEIPPELAAIPAIVPGSRHL